jgi:biotin carboxylase
MKRALVLGVGAAQLDLIRYLKERAWWVAGCSYREEGQGISHVDRFALIDIRDVAGLTAFARSEGVDRVISVGSDAAVHSIAAVSERLGLACPVKPETALITANKIRLRRFLDAHGISPVPWRAIQSARDLADWVLFPAILKPACSQGQRGVFKVTSRQEAAEHLPAAMGHSLDGEAILEAWIEGPEVSVHLFLEGGRRVFAALTERRVLPHIPGGIPEGHVLRSRAYSDEETAALQLSEAAAIALGLADGPVYFQLKLGQGGPRILEVAPRLDGCHLWRLIRMATGVDLLDMAVSGLAKAEGGHRATGWKGHDLMLGFVFQAPGARFDGTRCTIPADARFHELYYQSGEHVRPVNGVLEKVGYFIREV